MSPIDTDVISVLAVDPDNGDNGTVVYSISPANPFYNINSSTGKIRTSGVVLDRESPNTKDTQLMRTIVVSATDRGTPPLRSSVSTTVFVNLLDLNDNDPTFLNLPHVTEVPESLPIGSSVFKVRVSDPDEDENGQVTMVLQMGMPRLDFTLNTSTGVLVSTARLDREQISQYLLRVVAYDAGQFPRTSTSTLTVTVLDVNDGTPTFYPKMYNVSLQESIRRDFVVSRLNCTDSDSGLNAELSYFITEGNQDGKFSVGFRDGVVRTVVGLDRETQAAYTLLIEAIDNGPAGSRRTGTATVYIEVLDVNDNRPIFLQNSYETSILESAPRGASILQAGHGEVRREGAGGGAVSLGPAGGGRLKEDEKERRTEPRRFHSLSWGSLDRAGVPAPQPPWGPPPRAEGLHTAMKVAQPANRRKRHSTMMMERRGPGRAGGAEGAAGLGEQVMLESRVSVRL
ncbi:hypothetical protein COCON_G00226260 [Conger conger]|uniref:Cadherin domain-containing protein n=1 Tax=Conger conger TaxID=82655 RepID=A0A9Q1CX04_CONCO|nr:hypothetical protein COCON_G00226260 [Conger conger]